MFKKFQLLCVTESKKLSRRVKFLALACLVAVSINSTGKASAAVPSISELPFTYNGVTYNYLYTCVNGYDQGNGHHWIAYHYFNVPDNTYFTYEGNIFLRNNGSVIETSNHLQFNYDVESDQIVSGSYIDYNYNYFSSCPGVSSESSVAVNTISSLDIYNSSNQLLYHNQEPIPVFDTNLFLSASFEYPKMLGPYYHADLKMTELTTHVPLRVKTNVPFALAPELLDHIQIMIVKKTDKSYAVVDTVDPYLENYQLSDVLQYDLFEFSLPLMGGETNYYSLAYVFDDEYLSQHPGNAIINRYDFSFTGLFPSDSGYEYAQTPILPNLDSNGNTNNSTGSIIGDLVNKQLSETWSTIQLQFADFIYIYDLAKNPPAAVGGSAPLYSGDFQLAGKTVPVVFDPFHQFPIPPIVQTVTTFMAYFSLGWFFIRKSSNLFTN